MTVAPTLTIIYEDNRACVAQIQSGYIKSNVMKNISPKFFSTHEMQMNGEILVTHIRSCENLADMFTKALPACTFEKCRHGIGTRRLREVLRTGGERP